MTGENSDKTPTPWNNEYHDRRKRAKQRSLTSPYIEPDNFEDLEKYGKVHQVQFKITPFAARIGEETGALFNLSLSQYCKALLYLNLGLVSEPTDRRRKRKR
jgi:hypothetical protein